MAEPPLEQAADVVRRPPGGVTARTLTPRQQDVIRLLEAGLSNRLIARELGLRIDTVKDHVRDILLRLEAPGRKAAVAQWRVQQTGVTDGIDSAAPDR